MSRFRSLLIGFVLAVCATAAQAAEGGGEIEALKQKRQEVEARYNMLHAQYKQAAELIIQQEDMVELNRAMNESRLAKEAKLRRSAKVATAHKKSQEDYAALLRTLEAELDADAGGGPLLKQAQTLDESIDDLDAQLRLANFMTSEVKRRCNKTPVIYKTYLAWSRAESAILESARVDAKVAAAAKAMEEARQLPADKATIEKAELTYNDAMKNSTAVAEAIKARDTAKKTHEELLAAKVAAHRDTTVLAQRITELEQKLKDAQPAKATLTAKIEEARARVSKNSEKVVEVRKAYYAASAAYQQAVLNEAPNESAAIEEMQKLYADKLEAKVAADPKAAALRRQQDAAYQELEELTLRLRKAGTVAKKTG